MTTPDQLAGAFTSALEAQFYELDVIPLVVKIVNKFEMRKTFNTLNK